jgi:hypothetical protein
VQPTSLPDRGFLGRLAADLADLLDVERVMVAIPDRQRADTAVVAACVGAPGALGRQVLLQTERSTGCKTADEALALGLDEDGGEALPWSYAHVPIAGADELLGAVTVVSRRFRSFTEQDLSGVEQLARRRVPQFDRRAERRSWREAV